MALNIPNLLMNAKCFSCAIPRGFQGAVLLMLIDGCTSLPPAPSGRKIQWTPTDKVAYVNGDFANSKTLAQVQALDPTTITWLQFSLANHSSTSGITSLTNLDLATNLQTLDVWGNAGFTTALDVHGLTNLTSLWINGTSPSNVNASGCTALGAFSASDCNLTEGTINLTGCPLNEALTGFNANRLQGTIRTIDLTSKTQMTRFSCNASSGGNVITTVILSGCTSLTSVYLGSASNFSSLTTLNCSGCGALTTLDVTSDSKLISVNVANTGLQTTAFSALITVLINGGLNNGYLDITGCPTTSPPGLQCALWYCNAPPFTSRCWTIVPWQGKNCAAP